MSGITKILTRTPSELGSIKTNKSPIVEENKQLPAEQWNTAADAIIEIQTVIGEAANPAAGTITEVLSDHEERIDELEQSGGGGSPDLEWWEPVWTPMDNVDDVANVECQYTRVHRAAGGSLVTLEGAITVTPTASGSQCVVMADLPIAKPGAQFSLGMATGGLDGVNVSIADTGDGDQLVISGDALGTEVVPVTFRISYRAA